MLRVGVIVRNDTQKERMIFTGTNQVKTGKRKRIITGAVKERRWEVKKAGGKKEEEEGDLYQRDRRKNSTDSRRIRRSESHSGQSQMGNKHAN